MKEPEIKLIWSKKENDWLFHYHDRAGKSMMGIFFEMLKIEENISFLQPSLFNPDKVPQTLKEMLTERGYDYKTLKITCRKIKT